MIHLFIEYPTTKVMSDVGRRTLRFYIHIGEFSHQSLIFEKIPNNNVYIYYGEDKQLLSYDHYGYQEEIAYDKCVAGILKRIKENPKVGKQPMTVHFLIIP